MELVLRETFARYEQDLIEFTRSLVPIPTERVPGVAYRACGEMISEKLTEIVLDYTLLEIPAAISVPSAEPGYAVLSSYGTGEHTLYFHGHYDVVPAVDPAQFQPRI